MYADALAYETLEQAWPFYTTYVKDENLYVAIIQLQSVTV